MDIYCPRCGEPWDACGKGEDMTVLEWNDMMARRGCPCCKTKTIDQIKAEHGGQIPARAQMTSVLQSVLGDDTDGLAAELEDAEALGLLDDPPSPPAKPAQPEPGPARKRRTG